MYRVEVVADSRALGVRLTTLEVTLPRILLAEQNTHRIFSRNTASSRAIPVLTRCQSIEDSPFVPEAFGKNRKGMQASELDRESNEKARMIWLEACRDAVRHARRLAEVGVHKEHANRVAETYSWVTQLITATEWDNYMNLRAHSDAQPEIQKVASMMRDALANSSPEILGVGDWHLPYVDPQDLPKESEDSTLAVKMSVGRCAAISYERHQIKKSVAEEVARYNRLLSAGHMSPFEHQACVGSSDLLLHHASFRWDSEDGFTPSFVGNFRAPWIQARKFLPNEDVWEPR